MRATTAATAAALFVLVGGALACAPTEGDAEAVGQDPEEADEVAADDEQQDDPEQERPRQQSEAEPQDEPEPRDVAPSAASADHAAGELAVHYLDVGQADATLLLHDEVAVLIDTGHWQRSDVGPHLRALGVDTLDLVVITHPHADHIGQFDQVLDGFNVDEVWWSGSTTTTATFERALDALERSDSRYEEPRVGDAADLGPLLVEVVNPPLGVDLDDLHDAGLAIRVTFGEVRLLFTGDAEAATEQRMVTSSSSTLDADVLKLGHHGSSTSTTSAFLAAVDPQVAIYSAGAGNRYGHPHLEVLERLDAAGVDAYGTDVHGSITIVTDGETFTVATETGRPDEPVDPSDVEPRGATDDE